MNKEKELYQKWHDFKANHRIKFDPSRMGTVNSYFSDFEFGRFLDEADKVIKEIIRDATPNLKYKNNHPTKQTVQTGSGDGPVVCMKRSGVPYGLKTGDTHSLNRESQDGKEH